jgi:ribonuclease Z
VEVTLVGTGTPLPDPNRAGPCTLVKAGENNGEHVLIDAGRGCVMRMPLAQTGPAFLSGLLITHLHSDHLTAFNDIVTTHWIATNEPTPLRVWGPVGLKHYVDHILLALGPDMKYRMDHHEDLNWEPVVEVTEVVPGDAFTIGSMSITCHETCHAPVEPTIGYRVESDGKVVALAGDTIPCDGLDSLTKDADVYVQTVIRDDIVKTIPIPRLQDILDYHSSVEQAGQVAAKNRVKTLMMTHYVPAPQPEQYPEWIAIAAKEFDGEIVMGDDLTSVTV